MSMINVLDRNTINRIAAGEVIERPASVVKELIENSIDAGATAVTCEIADGGIDLIRITDNGSGIGTDDIRTAFLRHATSKIKTADDLPDVLSLGFRGEALASIAAVAHVELITKTRDSFTGNRYVIEDGEEQTLEEIGCPDGTTMIVRDLFLNVPVRRKFLKTPTTEAGYVNDVIEKLALSHPSVSIKFISNGRTLLFTNGNDSIKNIVYSVYGREITAELIELDDEQDGIQVRGYIARPSVARSNRNTESYYVNGRYIRSNIIFKAIEDAYAPYLMQHKYPFTVLHMTIDTSTMDVNVHPTKQEVRFEKPDGVYSAVYKAVRAALERRSFVPDMSVTDRTREEIKQENRIREEANRLAPEPFETKRREEAAFSRICPEVRDFPADTAGEDTVAEHTQTMPIAPATEHSETMSAVSFIWHLQAMPASSADTDAHIEAAQNSVQSPGAAESTDTSITAASTVSPAPVMTAAPAQLAFDTDEHGDITRIHEETRQEFKKGLTDGYKIVGQVFDTYWIVQRGDKMFIIDQHAAHEKIIYERLMGQNSEREVDQQQVSPPIIISLTPEECSVVEEHTAEFASLGYTIDSFGGREYRVSTIPMQTLSLDPKALLLELIDTYLNPGHRDQGGLTISLKERLATCSCKAAVKGNTRLSFQEAEALIRELLTLENPFNCPHGRPVIISMTEEELEKRFKRII